MQADTRESEFNDIRAWKQHLGNWGAYAAAAGAALAMSTNASASIITSTLDLTVSVTPGPDSAAFSVGGAMEVLALHHKTLSVQSQTGVALVGPGGGLAHLELVGYASSGRFLAQRYVAGQAVLAAGTVSNHGTLHYKVLAAGGPEGGDFYPGATNGFMGFENGAGDLGWLHLQVTIDGRGYPTQLELISFAYNDVAGAPIDAGQTTETPEPGAAALGLLALGAAGILAVRNRRKELGKVTRI
jgi:PEP-CTERM motif